jgi:hypothetical protein
MINSVRKKSAIVRSLSAMMTIQVAFEMDDSFGVCQSFFSAIRIQD